MFRKSWSGGELALWELRESADELLPLLECEDPVVFANNQRQLEWIATRILLQNLIDHPFRLHKDGWGKPHINQPGIHISFSHCSSYVAAMLSSQICGIDIERIDERILRIAHRFLSAGELQFLGNSPSLTELYIIWGAKEAAYKWYGRKSVDFAADMQVRAFKPSENGNISLYFGKELNCELYASYRVLDGHVLLWIPALSALP